MESKKPLTNKPRIAMVGTDWSTNNYRRINNAPGGISQYRLINPMRALEKYYDITYWGSDFSKGAKGKTDEEFYAEFFSKYDLIISKITDNPGAASSFAFCAQHFGVPLIVDIDDNIWEVKEDQPGHVAYHKGSQKLAIASTFVSFADTVFCSTEPLAQYVRTRMREVQKIEKDTVVLPNCIDPRDFMFTPVSRNPTKIVIGWQGSTTHHEDLKVAMPAIGKLLKEYPNLYLELLGGVENEKIPDLFSELDESVLNRVSTIGGVPAYDTFPYHLSQQKWDIGIAPLTDDLFNHAKSHIKWMEYAMFSIPCVASYVYPYYKPIQGTDTIVDNKTGFTATPNEWYEKLKTLIDSPELRRTIGNQAKEYVTENWTQDKHAYKWKEAIDRILLKQQEAKE